MKAGKMLEAVNSVLQSAPLKRVHAEQLSPVDSFAGNPDRTQKVAQAPYISPYIHMDVNLDMAVLQIRDSDTGDVVRQIPSEATIESRSRDVARRAEMMMPKKSGGKQVDVSEAGESVSNGLSNRQIAAFEAASRSGNSSSKSLSLFA